MLALNLQFGGKSYVVSQSKAANAVVHAAMFAGPTRQYTYDQHISRFNYAFNELELLGDPIQEHIKVQLFCESLQEMFMSQPKISVQLALDMALNCTEATGQLKNMRDKLDSNKAKAGEAHYVMELGIEPQKRREAEVVATPGTSARRSDLWVSEALRIWYLVSKWWTIPYAALSIGRFLLRHCL
jgi:hypothetical protein